MTLRLIFVRHGLSSFNKEGRIQGRNDLSTLTREGQLQAEAAGKTISSIPIDAIYSSPLQRASETTKIIQIGWKSLTRYWKHRKITSQPFDMILKL